MESLQQTDVIHLAHVHVHLCFAPSHLTGILLPLQRLWHMLRKGFLLFNSSFGKCKVDLILRSFMISSLISIPIYKNSLAENAMA